MAAAAREYVQAARSLGLGKPDPLRSVKAVPEERDPR